MARLVLSADAERADAVSDAGNILMRKLLCLDTAAVERACHDDEAPVAAFCCFFKECGRKVKQAAKTSPAAHFHNLFVIGRAFLCVAIRAVRFELVGEISACDINGAPARVLHGFPDQHAETIVVFQGKAGQTDADDAERRLFAGRPLPVQKIQRDHRAVIQKRITFTEDACGKVFPIRETTDFPH